MLDLRVAFSTLSSSPAAWSRWRWACSSKGATAASKPGSSAGWGRR